MSQRNIFMGIVAVVLITGILTASIVFFGARQSQSLVLSSLDEQELHDALITKALFAPGTPQFASSVHSCQQNFTDPLLVNVEFQYGLAPESCSFFVNERLVDSVRRIAPSCVGECPYGTFLRTFPLGGHDVREAHMVKICCDDICIRQRAVPLCYSDDPRPA